ncbi:MAG: anti-sigma factor domain-containing protein [Desulfocucumaceae bacterium]
MKQKAVVLDIKNKYCTVLTADGDFRKIKMRGNIRPGQEILLPDSGVELNKYALAACLVLFLITAGLMQSWMSPAVAAYVCLDINPSVEMSLDNKSIVRGIRALNDDGRELIAGLDIKGKGVQQAVESVIDAAVAKKYILPEGESVVMSAITPVGGGSSGGVGQLVEESIKASLQNNKISAEVAVGNVSQELRDEAEKAGLSAGRYVLYLGSRERGVNVSPSDFKNKSIKAIEKDQKIKVKDILQNRGNVRQQDISSPGLPAQSEKHNREIQPGQRSDSQGKQAKEPAGQVINKDSKKADTGDKQRPESEEHPADREKPGNGWGPGGQGSEKVQGQDNSGPGEQPGQTEKNKDREDSRGGGVESQGPSGKDISGVGDGAFKGGGSPGGNSHGKGEEKQK